ncbi:SMC-Scp complex subunit ScpB, partial [archaeon CG_4_8_14_3_um_filter_38_5]
LYRMTVDRNLINGLNELVPDEFSKSVIKTLSVIAWKQGITQSEVVRIRGNKSYAHIEQLIQLGFINAEPYGRTAKLNLANKFFEYFDINKGEEKFIFKQFNE